MAVRIRSWHVSAIGVTVAFVLSACAAQAGAAGDSPQAGAFCPRPVMVSRLPRAAVLDTTWYRLGPALAGCRIVNRDDRWAIEDNWFAIRGQPGRQYRKAELDSLGARGVLKEDTRLLAVGYRFMVKAGTATEARTVAKAELPTRPPRQVRKELLRLEREHQARLKEPSPPVPRP